MTIWQTVHPVSLHPRKRIGSARENCTWTRTRRIAPIFMLVAALALGGCKSSGPIDRSAAKSVSDVFMSYLASNRVNDAVGEMEQGFLPGGTRERAEVEIRKLFDYCGRPLDSEFKHDEVGFRIY